MDEIRYLTIPIWHEGQLKGIGGNTEAWRFYEKDPDSKVVAEVRGNDTFAVGHIYVTTTIDSIIKGNRLRDKIYEVEKTDKHLE